MNNIIRFGAAWYSNAVGVPGVAEVIVAPASNTKGLLLQRASFSLDILYTTVGFKIATVAPVASGDGITVVGPDTSGGALSGGRCDQQIFVPPGYGLYFVPAAASAGSMRSCLYTLL